MEIEYGYQASAKTYRVEKTEGYFSQRDKANGYLRKVTKIHLSDSIVPITIHGNKTSYRPADVKAAIEELEFDGYTKA